MRTRVLTGVLTLLLALPLSLRAQSVSELLGTWTFDRETPRGAITHTVTFTIDPVDEELTATMTTPWGETEMETVSFLEGVLTFTFEAPGPGGRGGDPDRTYQGTLEGDRIQGEMEGPRGGAPVVLTRVNG
ncbi:MAG: hypothetical protein P8188_09750 [Gemmatimonadota bacterium]|jgi:hypothetical protein